MCLLVVFVWRIFGICALCDCSCSVSRACFRRAYFVVLVFAALACSACDCFVCVRLACLSCVSRVFARCVTVLVL